MPQVFWLPIYEGRAPAAAATVFTMNAAVHGRVAIRTVDMSNPTYGDATVYVWKVPKGGTFPADAVPIVPGWVVGKQDKRGVHTVQWTGFRVLATTGDKIYAQSTGGVVDISISGGYAK